MCSEGINKYDYISKKYEFPGGKIKKDETKEDALKREIKEELDMDIIIKNYFLKVDHIYPNFSLIMHSYICTCDTKKLKLNEHINRKWLRVDEMDVLDWAAADIPIVQKLKDIK